MKKLLFLLIPVVLGSCATSYQSQGFTGGYSETRLAPDTVSVRFNGNGFASRERVSDLALLRATELCINEGYTHMLVLDAGQNTSNYLTSSGGGSSFTQGQIRQTPYGANYTGYTNYNAPQITNVAKHESCVMVRFLKSKGNNPNAIDAAYLSRSLKAKYKIH